MTEEKLKSKNYEQGERIEALLAENAELKEKISVLLSCKNCPENKGGYICQKEYEDKCLSQKIQYIKELQEENEELKEDKSAYILLNRKYVKTKRELNKAKSIIKELLKKTYGEGWNYSLDAKVRAENFLKGE